MEAFPRILVLSAAIGEGHDLPARVLAADLRELAPGVDVLIADGLRAMGTLIERVVIGGSPFGSAWGNRFYDAEYWLFAEVAPVRRLGGRLLEVVGGRGVRRLIAEHRADLVVSTYPGVSELLGRLRRRGLLRVPAVSAITDLAALRYWAHPDVDLHLVTHPESVEEVRRIAGEGTAIVPVHGLYDPAFLEPRGRQEARRALGLPLEPPLVVISGGGWGVGDLAGAVDTVLSLDGAQAVVIAGRNDELRGRLEQRFGGDSRVRVLGFTEQMSDLLAAGDALVHSTAGLTVLEAHIRGCPIISYGWGRGHIRANNRAFLRFGLAEVARDRPALRTALRRALEHRPEPDGSFAALPSAAAAVLDHFARRPCLTKSRKPATRR